MASNLQKKPKKALDTATTYQTLYEQYQHAEPLVYITKKLLLSILEKTILLMEEREGSYK